MALSDDDLLREYVRDGSNPAFSELVRRYLNAVYSAALRQVRSTAIAEEIAQSVFLDLSRSAAKLKPGQPLIAWLYLVTRRTAIDMIRRESRRQARERIALEIADMKPDSSLWAQIEPFLDEALEALPEADRRAILLRYIANQSLHEVGKTLGTSDDAAQKRISRALEQLRVIFARRSIIITAAGLATDLSAHAIISAPAALGATISANALSASLTPLLQTTHSIAMTSLNKTLIAATVLLTSGVLYEAHLIKIQQGELHELRLKSEGHLAETREIRSERDRSLQKLASIQESERRSQAARRVRGHDAAIESELDSWLTRIDQLKQSLIQMPEKNIPEMKFLTLNDWLTATLDNKLQTDTDIRSALNKLRSLAKMKPETGPNLSKALTLYAKANNGQSPSQLSQLSGYLNPPLEEAILSRYEITDPASTFGRILQEKAPVDEDYDSLLFLTANSGGGIGFQLVAKFGDAVRTAIKTFNQANNGQDPVTPEQLFPYLPSAADQAKLKESWAAINGNKFPAFPPP